MKYLFILCLFLTYIFSCKKGDNNTGVTPPVVTPLTVESLLLDNKSVDVPIYGTSVLPHITIKLSVPVLRSSVPVAITLSDGTLPTTVFNANFQNGDSVVILTPAAPLKNLDKYVFSISTSLQAASGKNLTTGLEKTFYTAIDSSRKFPTISDSALLTTIQQKTFGYFWDYAHPVSGLARERLGSQDLVTTGGSGFGIMAIITGISRNFITRADGLTRLQTVVGFLKNTAQKFHGAFPHWLNGNTGTVIPFSTKDDGADLVETSYLMQGLLCARQYFSAASADETNLRNDINQLWNGVEWDWFRQNNQNVLYWHWSPDYNWDMNFPIHGWNECLITYILSASSNTHNVPAVVYNSGWAANGSNGFINGNAYLGIALPLGEPYGGPLFFSHYSFLGIKPIGLKDNYADYELQTKNHTLINYNFCKLNPHNYYGYSDSCWGLTASDILNGYTASSPTNDVGVIAPTAAISSLPYTPVESMQAIKFYYYVLGDKLWKQYGFVDAFSLKDLWFADSFLAIDQGPEIIMIENYRTGLLWNLLTSCPEIKTGMKNLGFSATYL